MLEASFARLRISIAAFSEERASSCPPGRRDSVAMVETQGSYEEVVRGLDREGESEIIGSERPSCHRSSGASWAQTHLVRRTGFAAIASGRFALCAGVLIRSEPARGRKKSSMCYRYGPSCPWTCRYLNLVLYGSATANHLPHFRCTSTSHFSP